MDKNEQYLSWMEGTWRRTITIAIQKAFKEIEIENGDSRKTLMNLIDGFIKNQLDMSPGKR